MQKQHGVGSAAPGRRPAVNAFCSDIGSESTTHACLWSGRLVPVAASSGACGGAPSCEAWQPPEKSCFVADVRIGKPAAGALLVGSHLDTLGK